MPPAPNSTEILTTMAVENLQHLREERPANMSRRRFFCTQLNSLVIAIITCLSFVLFWILTRIETMNNLVADPCSLGMLFLYNITGVAHNKNCNLTIS